MRKSFKGVVEAHLPNRPSSRHIKILYNIRNLANGLIDFVFDLAIGATGSRCTAGLIVMQFASVPEQLFLTDSAAHDVMKKSVLMLDKNRLKLNKQLQLILTKNKVSPPEMEVSLNKQKKVVSGKFYFISDFSFHFVMLDQRTVLRHILQKVQPKRQIRGFCKQKVIIHPNQILSLNL